MWLAGEGLSRDVSPATTGGGRGHGLRTNRLRLATNCQAVDGEFAVQKLTSANLRCGLPGCGWRVRRAEVGRRKFTLRVAGLSMASSPSRSWQARPPCGLPGCRWRVRRAEVGKREPLRVAGMWMASSPCRSWQARPPCGLPGCGWRVRRAEVGKREFTLRVARLSMANLPSRSWQARPPAGCQLVDGEFAKQKLASANLRFVGHRFGGVDLGLRRHHPSALGEVGLDGVEHGDQSDQGYDEVHLMLHFTDHLASIF